ncbi:MAG: hypothetical protein V7677_17410 [Motiliproteus sp.]
MNIMLRCCNLWPPYPLKGKKANLNKQYKISGQVTTKETSTPIPDVIVQAFIVDLDSVCGKERNWYNHLKDSIDNCSAGADSTDLGGTFNIFHHQADLLEHRTGIGLLVWSPDDEDQSYCVEPLYKSPVPKSISSTEDLILRIPEVRLQSLNLIPPKLSSIEILDQSDRQAQEIEDWQKKDQKQRDEKANIYYSKASEAFKKFKPSSLTKSIREQANLLENSEKLKETLVKVRNKTLIQLKNYPSSKERFVELPKEVIKNLGLSEEIKEVEVQFSEFHAKIKSSQNSGDFATKSAIQAAENRQEREQNIATELYEYYKKNKTPA